MESGIGWLPQTLEGLWPNLHGPYPRRQLWPKGLLADSRSCYRGSGIFPLPLHVKWGLDERNVLFLVDFLSLGTAGVAMQHSSPLSAGANTDWEQIHVLDWDLRRSPALSLRYLRRGSRLFWLAADWRRTCSSLACLAEAWCLCGKRTKLARFARAKTCVGE